jgi:senataxin
MHPDISSFPSKAFYEARLADGPNMEVSTRQSWHDTSELFPPYAFLHVRGSREERGKHHSLFNRQEASVAVALYARLVQECKDVDLSQRVGIVTAYKAQVGELRKQFRNRFGQDILEKIDINTVDGYQGQEKDIIILSCVRGGTPDGSGIGFLSDVRRMNVALTRAKSSLFVLGDAKALQSNENWRKLVEDAKERGFLREVDPSSFTLRAIVQPKTISPGKKAPAKGKKRERDVSKFAILPAPDGLMKPGELAKSTSGLNASDGAKSALASRNACWRA